MSAVEIVVMEIAVIQDVLVESIIPHNKRYGIDFFATEIESFGFLLAVHDFFEA